MQIRKSIVLYFNIRHYSIINQIARGNFSKGNLGHGSRVNNKLIESVSNYSLLNNKVLLQAPDKYNKLESII